jgi:hypothetical protein
MKTGGVDAISLSPELQKEILGNSQEYLINAARPSD